MTDLFSRYDVPGPRYTSYPTVPAWSRTPSADDWLARIRAGVDDAVRQGMGASVYIHIPFCESLCT
jgi:coproporphyrinogen III oxidase-like Fe-S oxidoreductase